MNILFLADPNSIHDMKWITFFSEKNHINVFLLHRSCHSANERLINSRIVPLGSIEDFSVVRFYRNFVTAYRLRKIIRQNEIDVFHILYTEPNALWSLFRKYLKVPIVLTCRGTDVLKTIPLAFAKKNLLNRIVAAAYKRSFWLADYITGTSSKQLDSVKDFSGRANKLAIVRTGVDFKRLQSDTSTYFPLKDFTPFILFPRYIKPVYNHEFCLASIALLPDDVKRQFKMVFVGKDSGDLSYQFRLQKMMEVQGDVRFEFIEKQSQESIFELYKRSSLVVMTPLSDGSPVSGMEALLCGAKLVLGPLDYDPELFSQTIQLKRWDPHELAEVMSHVLTNPDLKFELAEETRHLMDRKFNMEKMANIYGMVSDSASVKK
jgi:glycosyltransferase involved in cell wall biosynthesis